MLWYDDRLKVTCVYLYISISTNIWDTIVTGYETSSSQWTKRDTPLLSSRNHTNVMGMGWNGQKSGGGWYELGVCGFKLYNKNKQTSHTKTKRTSSKNVGDPPTTNQNLWDYPREFSTLSPTQFLSVDTLVTLGSWFSKRWGDSYSCRTVAHFSCHPVHWCSRENPNTLQYSCVISHLHRVNLLFFQRNTAKIRHPSAQIKRQVWTNNPTSLKLT